MNIILADDEQSAISFDIQSNIELLCDKFPLFRNVVAFQDDDEHGKKAMLTMTNKANPRFSLMVTLHEKDGVCLDMGKYNTLIEFETDMDVVLERIFEILEDQVIMTRCYYDEEDFQAQDNSSMMRIDYMADEFRYDGQDPLLKYQRFLEKIRRPLSKVRRPFTWYKGIIETSNWSGSIYERIER